MTRFSFAKSSSPIVNVYLAALSPTGTSFPRLATRLWSPPCLWTRRFQKSSIFRRRLQKPRALFLWQSARKTKRLLLSGAPRLRRSRLAGPLALLPRNLDRLLRDKFARADVF